MKFLNKKLLIGMIVCGIFLLGGCEDTSNYKLVTCSKDAILTDSNTSADLKYQIYYEDDYVKKTISTEKVTSTNKTTLKGYKSSFESAFSKYKDIDYYDNTVTMSGDAVVSKTIIDYTKVDYKKILEIEGDKGNIFTKKGQVKLKTLLDLYKKYGSQCDD